MRKLTLIVLSSLAVSASLGAQQPAAPAPATTTSLTPDNQISQPRANTLNPTPNANDSAVITTNPANATPIPATGSVPPASALSPTSPDGVINPNGIGNVAAVQQAPGVGGLMGMDANGDSMLSKQEFLTYYERQFDAMEKNTIGVVDLRRMQEAAQQPQ